MAAQHVGDPPTPEQEAELSKLGWPGHGPTTLTVAQQVHPAHVEVQGMTHVALLGNWTYVQPRDLAACDRGRLMRFTSHTTMVDVYYGTKVYIAGALSSGPITMAAKLTTKCEACGCQRDQSIPFSKCCDCGRWVCSVRCRHVAEVRSSHDRYDSTPVPVYRCTDCKKVMDR